MSKGESVLDASHLRIAARAVALVALVAACLVPSARAAERDICENRSGQDLVRCIEASVRGQTSAPPRSPPPDNARSAAPAPPGPMPVAPVTAPPALPSFPAEDCTGRAEQEMRRCLAAGGRLQPSAAVAPPPQAAPAEAPKSAGAPEPCDGKTGEDLRACVERTARAPLRNTTDRTLDCTGYHAADQGLCVHRNTAIAECRNRKQYPDFDVCMRSQMNRAPEPKAADCSRSAPQARGHCEARNRVYKSCVGDRIGYFACLDRHLGTDAVLRKR